ncbi:DNA circularization N-terminal domain-containing protein [Moritella sp. F3]|uniref:DNA circularization N-terminal domain-containing protein n=1 Tax=Moritella sp. F3 TaxID=2718882 RepID=UPI0018E1B0B9|nr:DNA circularization N-terminal domain-containing protein [Moritella sp. F3]GIC79482.1 hypothetical protein FMO001_42090 [Moritella sp. F1]GIC79760.1 hypothetical protein FMO003_00410 [Moritella sp. F3]
MWERQYEQGRWNGLELNILSTSLDGGKRLHVSEIPYADLPSIKVMGSSASKFDLEVVFVGSSSLIDANKLLASLNEIPKGELEHPWLGEIPLVFESYSQTITTKRGLVTLSLKFIRDGKTPKLISSVSTKVSAQQQATIVEGVSTKTFVQDVEEMDIADMNSLQQSFTHAINELMGIANELNVPSQMLSALNQELNSAFVAISSIANAPGQFAEQLSKTIDSVANAVRSEPDSENEAVDNSRTAQATMLAAVNIETPSAHYNVQMVTAAVKMSKDIATLEQDETFSVINVKGQPSIILSDLQLIVTEVNARIDEVTDQSTLESTELFNSLITLKEGVDTQYSKVKLGVEPQRFIERGRFIPALALAHELNSESTLVMALNPSKHPLFLAGTIGLRVSE